MLTLTKTLINNQKKEIIAFANNEFGATFVSVMNGKNRFLQRTSYGYTHLRFTKKTGEKKFFDSYIYVTSSTTTIKQEDAELSDRCFNVREEVLFAHSDNKNVFFLVDYGRFWAYCSREWARTHIVKFGEYEGRKVCTVRLPSSHFVQKTTECKMDYSKLLSMDALYIQNVTYSKYRKRGGLLKVEVFKGKELQAIKFYTSTGAFLDEMKEHGLEFKQCTVQKWAREKMTKELQPGKFFRFSKSEEVTDVAEEETTEELAEVAIKTEEIDEVTIEEAIKNERSEIKYAYNLLEQYRERFGENKNYKVVKEWLDGHSTWDESNSILTEKFLQVNTWME